MRLDKHLRYDDYNYDELLDLYNEKGDKRYLIYCYSKFNNYNLLETSELLKLNFIETIFVMINIQNECDGDSPYEDYLQMFKDLGIEYSIFENNGEIDISLIVDDYDDSDWNDIDDDIDDD